MHPEINSPDISKVYACVFRTVRSPIRTLYKHISLSRDAHALTGLMFALTVTMF